MMIHRTGHFSPLNALKTLYLALLLLAFAAPACALQGDTPAPAKPLATYRLLFTLTDMEDGKKIGVQHFTLISDERGGSELRVGSKVPVPSGPPDSSQITYVDIGLNISVRLEKLPEGLQLYSHVEQSSIAAPPSDHVYQRVIRSASLSNNALLFPGKPTVLGSFDIPGSTRHSEVEVTLEPVH